MDSAEWYWVGFVSAFVVLGGIAGKYIQSNKRKYGEIDEEALK